MAQNGYTPILIYGSGTTGHTPDAANLTSSASGAELALNYFDGKLFYKDNSGTVQVLATKGTGTIGGSNTQIQFNNNGALGGSSSLTWDGTYLTANSIKDSALTSGRLTYAGASGLLTDSATLTYNGSSILGVGSFTRSTNSAGVTIEIGSAPGNAINGQGANDLEFYSNAYYNSGFKFAGTGYASRLDVGHGDNTFRFFNSTATGVAGGTISWLTSAILNVNPTTGLTNFTLDSLSTGTRIGSYIQFNRDGTGIGAIGSTSALQGDTSADFGIQAGAGKFLRLYAKNATSPTVTIDNALVGINTNAPTAALHVVSGASNPAFSLFGSNYTTGGYLDIYDYVNTTHRGYLGYGSTLITGAGINDFGIAPGPGCRLVFGSANGGQIDGFVDSSHSLGWGTTGIVSGLVGGIQVGNATGTASSYNPAPVLVGFQSTTGGVPSFVGNWSYTGWWGIGANSGTAVAQVRIGNVNVNGSGAAFTASYPVLVTGGIEFSNTSTAMYDYEEGTWPVTDQSGAGLTFTLATGVYRKIGTLVYVQIDLQFPVTGSSAQAVLSLPYTAKTTVNDGSSGGGASNYFGGAGIPQAYVGSNSAKANLYYSTGGSSLPMPNSLASNKEISFAFCYHTDS